MLNKFKKKQRITTDIATGSKYMERGCASDCGIQTNSLYDSNVKGYKQTVTNICCQTDGCNHAALKSKTNKLLIFSSFLISCFLLKF